MRTATTSITSTQAPVKNTTAGNEYSVNLRQLDCRLVSVFLAMIAVLYTSTITIFFISGKQVVKPVAF